MCIVKETNKEANHPRASHSGVLSPPWRERAVVTRTLLDGAGMLLNCHPDRQVCPSSLALQSPEAKWQGHPGHASRPSAHWNPEWSRAWTWRRFPHNNYLSNEWTNAFKKPTHRRRHRILSFIYSFTYLFVHLRCSYWALGWYQEFNISLRIPGIQYFT